MTPRSRYSMGFAAFFAEMFVHPLGTLGQSVEAFVAWRQHLWVGSYSDIEDNAEAIHRQIMAEHPLAPEFANQPHISRTPVDLFNWIREYIADGIAGYYNPKTRRISILGDGISPRTSPLIYKVTQELNAWSVSHDYDDERVAKYGRRAIQNRMPDLLYHGTSTEHFAGIVRLGLMPMPHQSNYLDIHHDENTFVTASLPEAEMHAQHTSRGGDAAMKSRGRMWNRKGLPMVVVLRLPDPRKVVPDMDVDRQASRDNYDHSYNTNMDYDKRYSVDSRRASMHSGLFGYQGRIPAKFIDHMRIFSPYKKKWMKLSPDKFPAAIKKIDDQGYEFWSYLLGDYSS